MANRKKSSGRPALQPGRPASHHTRHAQGNFSAAGEHPLQGGRSTGIVGQTKQRFRTDQDAQDSSRASTKKTRQTRRAQGEGKAVESGGRRKAKSGGEPKHPRPVPRGKARRSGSSKQRKS